MGTAVAKKSAGWKPARYELGMTRTVQAPVMKLKPSKRTSESIKIATDIVVGGLLGSTAFMLVSPHCMFPNNPAAADHPEVGLLTGLLLTGTWWALTGENYAGVAGLGTTLGLYGICKLFV